MNPRHTGTKSAGARLVRSGERLVWTAFLIWIGVGVAPQVAAWAGVGGPLGPAPVIRVQTLEGSSIGEPELRERVVVLSFWASWCLPCRVEMPALESLYRRHAEEGLVVLGLVTDGDDEDGVRAFLAEKGITFPIAEPPPGLRPALGGVDRLPTTIIIDRRGVIRHRVEGVFAPPALRAAVRRLLVES